MVLVFKTPASRAALPCWGSQLPFAAVGASMGLWGKQSELHKGDLKEFKRFEARRW